LPTDLTSHWHLSPALFPIKGITTPNNAAKLTRENEQEIFTENSFEQKSAKTDNWLSFNQKSARPLFVSHTFLPKRALSKNR
jgi:hypothetical protein